MNTIPLLQFLLPVLLILLQTILFSFMALWILKRLGIITSSFIHLEATQAITAAAYLFSAVLISAVSIKGLFNSFLTYKNMPDQLTEHTLIQYSRFFLVALVLWLIHAAISWLFIRVICGTSTLKQELEAGNFSIAILFGTISITLAFTCFMAGSSIIHLLVPVYLNFQ